MASKSYQVSAAVETNKLATKEGGWNLPGLGSPVRSRTRNGGSGRPTLIIPDAGILPDEEPPEVEPEPIQENTSEDAEIGTNDGDEASVGTDANELNNGGDDGEQSKKPSPRRIILDVLILEELVENHACCPECKGPVSLSIDTVCLASNVNLVCESCETELQVGEACKTAHGRPDNRCRSDNFAINVLYVLGFISMGDGGAEAARLLGLLDLPNDTTMETRSFVMIEERIGPAIRAVTEEIIQENLVREVKATVDAASFVLWKQALDENAIAGAVLDQDKKQYPKIDVSYDMAWQQRSSGHRYNSASGHGLFIGKHTRLPISMEVKSKLCNFCSSWHKNKDNESFDPPIHECWKNHEGSSSSMEPIACLDMTVNLFKKQRVAVSTICADDDASTRSLLRWSNADYKINHNTNEVPKIPVSKGINKGKKMVARPDKGKLPGYIVEPKFVADPNHRRKGLTGALYQLASQKVALRHTMTKMDAQRIGRNYGYFIRSLPGIPEDQYEHRALAVLEHHFDSHDYCGPWCKRKMMTTQERAESARYYRNKEKKEDAKLYIELQQIVARFTTMERLKEVDHGMDTNVNESFNNTATWIAPKNKVYCASGSLHNRLAIAVGIVSLGLPLYFKHLFKHLKIEMTPNVLHYLTTKEKQRKLRLEKQTTSKFKRNRNKRKFSQLREEERQAKVERAKREGTYVSGQNVAEGTVDGYTIDDIEQPDSKPAAKKRKVPTCSACGKKGHASERNKLCVHNARNPLHMPLRNDEVPCPQAVASLPTDADEMDNFDSMPLEDNNSDDEEFFDCEVFDDDFGII